MRPAPSLGRRCYNAFVRPTWESNAMSRWICIGLILLPLLLAGCSSERERGINRDAGRPKSGEEPKQAAPKK
jgi:hypothetical protein